MADQSLLAVQAALVEVLRTSATLGLYCRAIDAYAGQVFDAVELEQRPINCPACFVELESTTSIPKANRLEEKTGVWNIYCLTENFRGNAHAQQGNAVRIGALILLHDLQTLLVGNDLGLNDTPTDPFQRFWPLRLLTEESIRNDGRWSLYRARYQTQQSIRFTT